MPGFTGCFVKNISYNISPNVPKTTDTFFNNLFIDFTVLLLFMFFLPYV